MIFNTFFGVFVDDGAKVALVAGRSLLPAGVTGVTGEFERGEAVRVQDQSGIELGRGLIAYPSDEAQAIMGLRSGVIENILGYRGRDERGYYLNPWEFLQYWEPVLLQPPCHPRAEGRTEWCPGGKEYYKELRTNNPDEAIELKPGVHYRVKASLTDVILYDDIEELAHFHHDLQHLIIIDVVDHVTVGHQHAAEGFGEATHAAILNLRFTLYIVANALHLSSKLSVHAFSVGAFHRRASCSFECVFRGVTVEAG